MVSEELSADEWKWDEGHFTEEGAEGLKEYSSYINQETRDAQRVWHDEAEKRIGSFRGYVADIATGLGGMFGKLLRSDSPFLPIATDVDPNVLVSMKQRLQRESSKEFLAVATDAKHLAIGSETLGWATSLAGLNNIPDTVLALREIHRALAVGGRLVVMHTFVDEGSGSAKLAREHNSERAFIERYLVGDLAEAGFSGAKVSIVSSAVWAENPMDLLPVAGDMKYFAIVEAGK